MARSKNSVVHHHVLIVEGKGSRDGNYLLDLKRTWPSSLAPGLAWEQPMPDVMRTVAG
jgi:hypothetical protein